MTGRRSLEADGLQLQACSTSLTNWQSEKINRRLQNLLHPRCPIVELKKLETAWQLLRGRAADRPPELNSIIVLAASAICQSADPGIGIIIS